ncbi:NACHT domain-containing protein [Burkholderia vietnamiensis]|nr:hypothetical protein [Burkholderia vietnamiensis]MCA7988852.1 hypothetical protein [Burkholderia vietnamiensis]HDR8934500.1 hypothetical protein [Burkholderia vietnamiensis]
MTSAGDFRFTSHAERLFTALDQSRFKDGRRRSQSQSSGSELTQQPWQYWHDVPCIVLLGEPGSGKTAEFRHRVQELRQAAEHAFLSRWQDWCDGDEIFDTIDDKCSFFEMVESGRPVWWFIDALDEGRIKTEKAFDVLRKGLRRLHELNALHLVKLRLSCRSRDWRPSEAEQLSKFFAAVEYEEQPIEGLTTLQLLPLQEAAIRALAFEKLSGEHEVDRFMESLQRRHVTALASHPLTLAMMLSLCLEDNSSLGYDRTTLYAKAMERLAIEHNREHADQKPPQTLPAERIAIAQQIAVRVVLGGNDTITVPDSDARSDRAVDVSCTGAKRFEILETLNTGLFTQHTQGGFVFAHQSFAEFLAARDLSDRLAHTAPSRATPLFPIEHGVIPSPLRETAAWLAGMVSPFRRWLIEHDPLTAAQGDTIRYTSEERETLLMALADRFGERTWQREFDRFGDLARSVSDTALRQLLRKDRSMAVRQMTTEMIDIAEASDLFPNLLSIAVDPTDVPAIRAKATGILARRAPVDLAAVALSLLQLPADQDPQDDIAGVVAHFLYPQHLTTEQVLLSLHIPRQPFTLGHYRWFWEDLFPKRIPATVEDLHASLDTIVPLLTDDSDYIQLRPYAQIATSLLITVLDSVPITIEILGTWLVRLAEWTRHHGVADQTLHAQLVSALKAKSDFGSLLLHWRLANWPNDQEFLPWWHVPFYEELSSNIEAECWIELCRLYADQPNIGGRLFDEVTGLAFRHPAIVPMETVEALAQSVPAYQARWDSNRVSDLEGPLARSTRQQRQYKLESDSRDASMVSQIHANIDLLRSGHANALMWVIGSVSFDCFDRPPLNALADRYGTVVAQAIRDGVVNNWTNLADTSAFWPRSNVLPNEAVIAGMGFRELYPSNEDLPTFNEHQVDCLVWRVLHNNHDIPDLLLVLWDAYPEAFWKRLEDTLLTESQLPDDGHAIIWGRLAALEHMPAELTARIVDHLIRHRLPNHVHARRHALKMLLLTERPEVGDLIDSTIQLEWRSGALPAPWTESSAVAALSARWLLAPGDTQVFIEAEVFQGQRYRPRVVAFVNMLQELLGQRFAFDSRWPSTVPWESYAALLPLLYDCPPKEVVRAGAGWVSPQDQFLEARNALVVHLAKAPAHLACGWFAQWKIDPRYGDHRDWFANLHAEIEQRRADESWTPLEPATLEAVLVGQSALVRNDTDAAAVLNETIATGLVPAFRSDHSLVPLLWEGTKVSGDRKPLDEKALQTAIYGQLMPMLAKQPVVGAREPEVFDAKKPDARISYLLDSGMRVDIPIEIKWAGHADVWDATDGQVLRKYMQDPRIRHAVYIVGWAGAGAQRVKRGPNGEEPSSAAEFAQQLQNVTDGRLDGTGKSVVVHVIDASVLD